MTPSPGPAQSDGHDSPHALQPRPPVAVAAHASVRSRACWRSGRAVIMGVLNVTPDSFSDGGRFLDPGDGARACTPPGRRGRRHPRRRRRIDPPLRRRRGRSGRGGTSPPRAGAAGRRRARRSGLDRHHEGQGRRLGAGARRRASSTTSGACSAIPTWPAWSPQHAVPVIIMHNRESADPALDIMADIAAFLRALARDRRSRRHRPRRYRARSRHRLRQDAGAEHHGARPARRASRRSACRCSSAPRASASSTRSRRRRRISGWAARSPLTSLRSLAVPPSSAPTMSPRPCRRCAWPPPSERRDERHCLRDRAVAARLSRRDAARGQGRPELHARPRARHRPHRGIAHRQARPYRRLRPGGGDRRARPSAANAIGWSRPRPARSPTPCSRASAR